MVNTAQGQVFDNAHNEYLQYLVTIGALGLITYVVFLVAAGWRMAVRRNGNRYIVGCLFAVMCYGAQALVNLSLPIATPIMWLLLSAGMAACREEHFPSPDVNVLMDSRTGRRSSRGVGLAVLYPSTK